MYTSFYKVSKESENISNISKNLTNYGYDYENVAGAVANAATDAAAAAAKRAEQAAELAAKGKDATFRMMKSAHNMDKGFKQEVFRLVNNNAELKALADKHGVKTLDELAVKIEQGHIEPDETITKAISDLVIYVRKNTNNKGFFNRLGSLLGTKASKTRDALDRSIEDYSEYLYRTAANNSERFAEELAKRAEGDGSTLGKILKWAAVVLGVGGVSIFGTYKYMSKKNQADDQYEQDYYGE